MKLSDYRMIFLLSKDIQVAIALVGTLFITFFLHTFITTQTNSADTHSIVRVKHSKVEYKQPFYFYLEKRHQVQY